MLLLRANWMIVVAYPRISCLVNWLISAPERLIRCWTRKCSAKSVSITSKWVSLPQPLRQLEQAEVLLPMMTVCLSTTVTLVHQMPMPHSHRSATSGSETPAGFTPFVGGFGQSGGRSPWGATSPNPFGASSPFNSSPRWSPLSPSAYGGASQYQPASPAYQSTSPLAYSPSSPS